MTPFYKSLTFWALVAAFLAYVARFFAPTFPMDQAQILSALLFLIGLFGIVPTMLITKTRSLSLSSESIFLMKEFWFLLVGVVAFVIHSYFPTFPLDDNALLALVLFIVGLFGIHPELRNRGLLARG